jgi:hypothetical protein
MLALRWWRWLPVAGTGGGVHRLVPLATAIQALRGCCCQNDTSPRTTLRVDHCPAPQACDCQAHGWWWSAQHTRAPSTHESHAHPALSSAAITLPGSSANCAHDASECAACMPCTACTRAQHRQAHQPVSSRSCCPSNTTSLLKPHRGVGTLMTHTHTHTHTHATCCCQRRPKLPGWLTT